MERREFFSKKAKLAGWLCFALVLVAGGVFEIRDGNASGWLLIVLFGVAGAILVSELLSSGPRLVLSGDGLLDRSLGTPVIPWESIVEVDTSGLKKSGYITLKLADERQRVANLSIRRRALASWQKMLGGGIFNTSLSSLDAPPAEVADAILKYRQHYAPKR